MMTKHNISNFIRLSPFSHITMYEPQRFEKFREKAQKKKQELMEAEAASQEVENPSDELLNRLEALTK